MKRNVDRESGTRSRTHANRPARSKSNSQHTARMSLAPTSSRTIGQGWPRSAPARTSGQVDVEQPIVLVIDDDYSVRCSLERLFRSIGLDVETFASARDFLRKPMPNRPACVVLDLCLSGSSGLEVQETLIRSGNEVPIIFISGQADVPSSVRAMKAGAVDFLQKPFSDQMLLDIIHGALGRDRKARRDRVELAAIRQRFDTLSAREREVLRIVIQGRLNREIADELGISEKTVKFHRGSVMKKMQVESLAELVRHADRLAETPSRSKSIAPAPSTDPSRAVASSVIASSQS